LDFRTVLHNWTLNLDIFQPDIGCWTIGLKNQTQKFFKLDIENQNLGFIVIKKKLIDTGFYFGLILGIGFGLGFLDIGPITVTINQLLRQK